MKLRIKFPGFYRSSISSNYYSILAPLFRDFQLFHTKSYNDTNLYFSLAVRMSIKIFKFILEI